MGVNFVLVFRKHLWMKCQEEKPRMRECGRYHGMEKKLESISLLLLYWGTAWRSSFVAVTHSAKEHASYAGLWVTGCPILIAKMVPTAM